MVGLTKSIYQEFKMPPAAYAAAKGALISMTKYFATTLAPKIRVNCVAPGGILRSQPDEFIKKYSEIVPLKRMALEKDVVDTIAWISSDKASYLTGQVIAVDGGWTAK
jgi:NAD(P)-dependent dehydrogenase (short-subunit alcohol dehydrogenase family)